MLNGGAAKGTSGAGAGLEVPENSTLIITGAGTLAATWLQGFADRLRVRASESLPIPDTDDSLLNLSNAELTLEDSTNATISVPLPEVFGDSSGRFFPIEVK